MSHAPLPPPLLLAESETQVLVRKEENAVTEDEVNGIRVADTAVSMFCKIHQRWDHDCSDIHFISYYRPGISILQNGPVCGLVALAMSAPLVGVKDITLEMLFEEALRKGYTKQGEMFSVNDMCELAKSTFRSDCEVHVIRDADRKQILECLLSDKTLLVPYDSDKNFSPCLKKGHKAHWAVTTGYFLAMKGDIDQGIFTAHKCLADKNVHNLFHIRRTGTAILEQVYNHVGSVLDVLVYARQGKSKHVGVWPLDSLLDSNANLIETDPCRAEDVEGFLIPEGGVAKGLCKQMVVISKINKG